MKISTYQDLIVWQKAMDLVSLTYQLTAKLPIDERYGLSSQLQRAAIAIPSNIAEGYSRNHRKEFIQFLSIALGSAAELETQLIIRQRLKRLQAADVKKALLINLEVKKMLYTIQQKLSSK